jgi:O-antigen ligase
MLIAIAGGLVSAMASPAPMVAILGGMTRSIGVVTFLVWLIAFSAGLHQRTARLDVARHWIVRSVIAFSVVVLVGRLGLPVVPFPGGSRATGPLGSASFTAATLCLIFPFALVDVAHESQSRRIESVGASVIAILALLATGSRAAIAGVLISIVVLVILRRGDAKVRRSSPMTLGLLALTGVAGSLFLGVFDRIGAIGESNGTAAGRLVLWEAGLRAVSKVPWLGSGLDQQEHVLGDFLPIDFESRFGDSVIVDRAHNWFIDLWLGGGIFVMLAFVVALFLTWRRARRDPFAIAAISGTAGYLAQAQFNFSLPAVEALMWLLLGASVTADHTFIIRGRRAVAPILIVGVLVALPFLANNSNEVGRWKFREMLHRPKQRIVRRAVSDRGSRCSKR